MRKSSVLLNSLLLLNKIPVCSRDAFPLQQCLGKMEATAALSVLSHHCDTALPSGSCIFLRGFWLTSFREMGKYVSWPIGYFTSLPFSSEITLLRALFLTLLPLSNS